MTGPDPRLARTLWGPYVADVALACEGRDPVEDTALVLAIWARETIFGTCPGYEPKGPNGRGDGGHGRGLPQIDDRGPFKHLIPPDGTDWPPFIQAQATCQVLATAREELAEWKATLLPGIDLAGKDGTVRKVGWDEVVACRYNASLDNIRWALRSGLDPNRVTTPGPLAPTVAGKPVGDYGRDVVALRDALHALYPGNFPPFHPEAA